MVEACSPDPSSSSVDAFSFLKDGPLVSADGTPGTLRGGRPKLLRNLFICSRDAGSMIGALTLKLWCLITAGGPQLSDLACP